MVVVDADLDKQTLPYRPPPLVKVNVVTLHNLLTVMTLVWIYSNIYRSSKPACVVLSCCSQMIYNCCTKKSGELIGKGTFGEVFYRKFRPLLMGYVVTETVVKIFMAYIAGPNMYDLIFQKVRETLNDDFKPPQ